MGQRPPPDHADSGVRLSSDRSPPSDAAVRLPQVALRRKRSAAAFGPSSRRPDAPRPSFRHCLAGETAMAMVCPQCASSYEQRLQCPTCNARLLYDPRGPKPAARSSAVRWQQTPWGRILIGLVLAQGLYFGLQHLLMGLMEVLEQSGSVKVDVDQPFRAALLAGLAGPHADGRRRAGGRRPAARRHARRPGRRLERRLVRPPRPYPPPGIRADPEPRCRWSASP